LIVETRLKVGARVRHDDDEVAGGVELVRREQRDVLVDVRARRVARVGDLVAVHRGARPRDVVDHELVPRDERVVIVAVAADGDERAHERRLPTASSGTRW
jgi:hypothetical protein